MLTTIHPKLPMRDRATTRAYYIEQLGFEDIGAADYPDYLILRKDNAEIHFFRFTDLAPEHNYGQVYVRTDDIDGLYQQLLDRGVMIHPNGALATRPWGQREFSLLDPDNNLLTFGQTE